MSDVHETLQPQLTKVFNAQSSNEGSSFVLTNLRPENCNDAQGRRDSDFQNVRNTINAKLPQLMDGDLKEVQAQIKQSGTVIEIK